MAKSEINAKPEYAMTQTVWSIDPSYLELVSYFDIRICILVGLALLGPPYIHICLVGRSNH